MPGLLLAELRERPAYVLLGEPGAGKTTAFAEEAKAAGTEVIPARDFVALQLPSAWKGKTLFIDGLDEMRAGTTDGRTQIDAIRQKLDLLGRPPFRLSCREADWRGASDREDLARVAPSDTIVVLHLDDLSDEQIALLLKENHGVQAPLDFIEQAREHRLDVLLGNPQTLGMLAEAVPHRWPDSLAETYALACAKLAEEPNKRHRDAQRHQIIATDEVLNAAGHACAVQLLAGIAGFALDQEAVDAAHPSFESIGLSSTPALTKALNSRLFDAHGSEERREPTHRRIAEYLGARFLAHQIERNGLPLGRVLALMAAEDGGIVSDLRGLHAWLAVHCPSDRPSLIDRDPLGIVLYGDLRSFNITDKRRLLNTLGREAKRYPWFRSQDWEASPFGALAGQDTAADFREILLADARDEAHESLLDCVLEALTHGEPLPELAESLLEIVRDASHWPKNRKHAIDAYLRTSRDTTEPLVKLLDDINSGLVADGDDEIMGRLLTELYPTGLPATQVLNYLHAAKATNLIGNYTHFWGYELFEKTKAQDFPVLLDYVAGNFVDLQSTLDDFHFKRFAGELLASGLENAGESASPAQLWQWLGIGLDQYAHCHLDKEHEERMAVWLNSRPETYRALLEFALRRYEEEAKAFEYFYRLERRFHGAEMPAGVEEWCFAAAQATLRKDVQRQLFDKGAFALVRRLGYTPELLNTLLAVAERYPTLETEVRSWLQSDWIEWRRDEAVRKAEHREERRTRIDVWQRHFRAHHAEIESGNAHPKLMHDLAMMYFGHYREAEGEHPIERLQAFFGSDAGIVLTTLVGLRRTLDRKDLPSVAEITKLATENQEPYISLACLAGADELARDGVDAVLNLEPDVQERLIAFRLTHDYSDTPTWFLALVSQRPEIVAEVLVAFGAAMFKAQKPHVAGVYALARDEAWNTVARHAALRLLEAYPLRAKKEMLGELGTLLTAAIKHADPSDLLPLIETKLSRSSLDAAQRSQWLSAGLLLAPDTYEQTLDRYVGVNQSRALLVAKFFDSLTNRRKDFPELSESAMALLIRLLAPHVSPDRPSGAHWVSEEMSAADLVRALISRLGASPTATASETFAHLLVLKGLGAWNAALRHQQEAQRIVSREANFQRPRAPMIVKTLANGSPACAADLHALLVQHLRDLASEDRDGNTTGQLRYWNVDRHDRPVEPRPENDCRDRLLELLREKLRPTGVDVQPEGEYRANKRADIRASFGGASGFNIPVEIKRDSHEDVWGALRNQLMAHYIRDPGTDGHGIYLVFWFGHQRMPTAADGGKPPGSADELESRLRAMLKPEEQQQIGVVVMDCAPPAA